MLRMALIIAGLLFAFSPAQAQDRIFRASRIDLEQDRRLDTIEVRLTAIEQASTVKTVEYRQETVTKAVVAAPTKPAPVPAVQQASKSSRHTTEELRQLIALKRPGGWQGAQYATVSPLSAAKQHLVGKEHGFTWDQVSGLSQGEALVLHDLAPGHGSQISPYRQEMTLASLPAKSPAPVRVAAAAIVQRAGSGCANGQCARQSQQQQSKQKSYPLFWRLGR